ncbi:hypothetical protein ACE6H2_018886 [Prunus campanulata]
MVGERDLSLISATHFTHFLQLKFLWYMEAIQLGWYWSGRASEVSLHKTS